MLGRVVTGVRDGLYVGGGAKAWLGRGVGSADLVVEFPVCPAAWPIFNPFEVRFQGRHSRPLEFDAKF